MKKLALLCLTTLLVNCGGGNSENASLSSSSSNASADGSTLSCSKPSANGDWTYELKIVDKLGTVGVWNVSAVVVNNNTGQRHNIGDLTKQGFTNATWVNDSGSLKVTPRIQGGFSSDDHHALIDHTVNNREKLPQVKALCYY